MKPLHLYIHIPFCKSKCAYCAFYTSVAATETVESYIDALVTDITHSAKKLSGYQVTTIYIGGGTPSLLDTAAITRVVHAITDSYHVLTDAEISIEINPESADKHKLARYRQLGINRISLGLQAGQDVLLKQMNRPHSLATFLDAYTNALEAGFTNINTDIIFGYPGQTDHQWHQTLHEVIKLQPQHISCYSLEVVPKTLLSYQLDSGMLSKPDEILDRTMYHEAIKRLKEAGYAQYELSNFCLPGYECRHNLHVWQHQEYRGFGAGAHSYLDGVHFHQIENIKRYISEPGNIMVDMEPTPAERKLEWLLLRLRLIQGFTLTEYENTFQSAVMSDFGDQFSQLFHQGYCSHANGRIRLTMSGLNVYDAIIRFLGN